MNILGYNGDPDCALFCVFDGHGGPEVSAYCAEVFPKKLSDELSAVDFGVEEDVKGALVRAYIATDDSLLGAEGLARLQEIGGRSSSSASSALGSLTSKNVGCTAVTALVKGTKLYVANAGDSRCILSRRRGELVTMSEDHKPELPNERSRIEAAGGYVTAGRVNGNLNLTRCIGDHEYKSPTLPHAQQIISCVPDVAVYNLAAPGADPDFLVLACDGIWDVMDNANVVNFVRKRLLPQARSSGDDADDSGRLDKLNWAPATPPPWPADAADASLTRALELTARQIVDKSLASESRFGIGCDNMSVLVVLFKKGPFGKDVLCAFDEMRIKTDEKEKEKEKDGAAEKTGEVEKEKKETEGDDEKTSSDTENVK